MIIDLLWMLLMGELDCKEKNINEITFHTSGRTVMSCLPRGEERREIPNLNCFWVVRILTSMVKVTPKQRCAPNWTFAN